MPQTEAGVINGHLTGFCYGDGTPDLFYSASARRKRYRSEFCKLKWALLIFLHKLIGNMAFLRFIPLITGQVLLPV
jgi:hypothetical protein